MASLALVIASDSVYMGVKEDRVTPLVESRAKSLGATLNYTAIVPNRPLYIRSAVLEAVKRSDLVLVVGGTGISPRDITLEAIRPLASKELPGFGEELRRRSSERIGFKGLLSRASCLVIGGSLVFLVPGSPDAVETALGLIGGFYDHALHQVRGGKH